MEYYVYNGKYQKVYVSDEMLEKACMQQGDEYGIEIINAMMESRNPKYANKLIEALQHEKLQNRVNATYAVLSLKDKTTISALKTAISALDESDYQNQISIRAITEAAIVILEGGVRKVTQLFFHDTEFPTLIKELFLSCYSGSRIPFTNEDIELLVKATSALCLKELKWIAKLKKRDYEEDLICCFTAFVRASKETNIILSLNDTLSQSLASSISTVLLSSMGVYCKEIAIQATIGLRKKYALSALNVMVDKPFNKELKKQYIKAMHFIDSGE